MNSHGKHIARRVGMILIIGACLACSFKPTTGFAQPGRTYTPPPPPPPPPSPPPRPYVPPPPPPPVNTQQSQMMQQMNRESTQRDMLKTRLDADAVMRAAGHDRNIRAMQPANGGFGGAPARNVMVEVIDVVVTTVEPNTQAVRLGLRKGDILVSYAGRDLVSTQQVQNLVKLHANDVLDIELVVIRNNQTLEFDVQPGRLGVLMRVQKQLVAK